MANSPWIAPMSHNIALKGDGHSLAQGSYLQARQDRANARHLNAVKALASVRRLLAPSVQVNIGRNQIVSQGGPAGRLKRRANDAAGAGGRAARAAHGLISLISEGLFNQASSHRLRAHTSEPDSKELRKQFAYKAATERA